jgi:hypothetical protein
MVVTRVCSPLPRARGGRETREFAGGIFLCLLRGSMLFLLHGSAQVAFITLGDVWLGGSILT